MKYKKYSAEFREEAVKLVIETSRPIARVARELGIVEGTLGNWVNVYRRGQLHLRPYRRHISEYDPSTAGRSPNLLGRGVEPIYVVW